MKVIDRITNKIWRKIYIPNANINFRNASFKVPRFIYNNFYKSNYESESWLNDLLNCIHNKRPIRSFVDVGVNIGQTLLKIKAINVEANYLGFEPNPFCCAIAEKIIAVNKFQNSSLIPCGLGDKNQVLKLKLSNNNLSDSSASMIEGFRKSKETDQFRNVSIFKLDSITDQIKLHNVDIIKIDIEGAELEAIKGMSEVLLKFNPIIIMEVLPSYNSSNTFRIQRQEELATVIKAFGYSIFQIKNKEVKLTFKQVIEFQIHSNVNESDYLLLPKDIQIELFEFN